MTTYPFVSFTEVMSRIYGARFAEDPMPFVAHAESPWMARLRAVCVPPIAFRVGFAVGVAAGLAVDVTVRLVVG